MSSSRRNLRTKLERRFKRLLRAVFYTPVQQPVLAPPKAYDIPDAKHTVIKDR